MNNTTTYRYSSLWSTPERVSVDEYDDRIEMIYKQTSMVTLSIYPSPPPEERVYKIIYSCVDGKWNKSEPIFGTINPPTEESYDFDE